MTAYQVDIIRFQLPQTGIHRDLHALCIIADKVDLDLGPVVQPVGRGILGRQDDLVAHSALFHPLAEPDFGVFVLVVVGSILGVSD